MKSIALVSWRNELDEISIIKKISNVICNRKWEQLEKQKDGGTLMKLELSSDINIYVIELPYDIYELKNFNKTKKQKINDLIKEICTNNNVNKCILSAKLLDFWEMDDYFVASQSGKILFKWDLTNILNNISYYSRGLKISDLEVTVIEGDSKEEVIKILRMLSISFKYITVVTNELEFIEDEANKIYDENGLSIRVTSDITTVIRTSEIIINLGDMGKYSVSQKIKNRAIIINYGKLNHNIITEESKIINGLDICLTEEILSKLPCDIFDCYDKIEIAEIVSLARFGTYEHASSKFSCEDINNRNIVNNDYRITAYIGQNNFIKVDNVKVKKSKLA